MPFFADLTYTLDPSRMIENSADLAELQRAIAAIVPGAALETVQLPGDHGLRLVLLEAAYPQHLLDGDAVMKIMNEPMYWAFCWAAGQCLALFLTEQPHYVAGKRVLDFGAGSGVVALAAARAGARSVVVCDSDPLACTASRLNAALNGVAIETISGLEQLTGAVDVVLAADVLYDRGNLHWLQAFLNVAPCVLLADSRIRDFSEPGYSLLTTRSSHTLPDLDESGEFRQVRLYLGERQGDD